jgi:hypothetical protein
MMRSYGFHVESLWLVASVRLWRPSSNKNIFGNSQKRRLLSLTHEQRQTTVFDLSTAEEFRAKAEDCRLQSDKAVSQRDKAVWLRIAESWLKMAQQADKAEQPKRR